MSVESQELVQAEARQGILPPGISEKGDLNPDNDVEKAIPYGLESKYSPAWLY